MNRIYDCNVQQDKVLVRLGDNVSRGWRLEQATPLEEDLEREPKEGKKSKAEGNNGRDQNKKETEDENYYQFAPWKLYLQQAQC